MSPSLSTQKMALDCKSLNNASQKLEGGRRQSLQLLMVGEKFATIFVISQS